jgi:hypothetical protein
LVARVDLGAHHAHSAGGERLDARSPAFAQTATGRARADSRRRRASRGVRVPFRNRRLSPRPSPLTRTSRETLCARRAARPARSGGLLSRCTSEPGRGTPAPIRHRRPASDQPRSQRPWVLHLAPFRGTVSK